MEIEHRDWHAEFNRGLRHFEVRGVVTTPAERSDGGYLVVYEATLQPDPQRNTDPAILILTLTLLQQLATVITPPPEPISQRVRYYVEAGPVEEAYTTVHIFYEGTCIEKRRVVRLG